MGKENSTKQPGKKALPGSAAHADRGGFSLVELIIVIAIMAILVGIVGTQVIPYLNRSREAKDLQLVDAFNTAATTAYANHAEEITEDVTVNVFSDYTTGSSSETSQAAMLAGDIVEYTGYSTLSSVQEQMSSTAGKTIAKIEIRFYIQDNEEQRVVTQAYDAENNKILDAVKSSL